MNNTNMNSFFRHALTSIGLVLLTQGVINEQQHTFLMGNIDVITGVFMVCAGAIWVWIKNKVPQIEGDALTYFANVYDAVSHVKAQKVELMSGNVTAKDLGKQRNGFFSFGKRSNENLIGVHPALVDLCQSVIVKSSIDFTIIDGVRTEKEQREYINRGVSWTMNSMHLKQRDGFSHAIDFAIFENIGGKRRLSNDMHKYAYVADIFKAQAVAKGLHIEWGGDWKKRDGMHIQIDI